MEQYKRLREEEIKEDLFNAYFDARQNKRNTINALAFERNFESKLFYLFDEIMQRNYELKKGICFIVNKPVKREIFAADFRDRVIHHFIYNYISPIFEGKFINDTYSCRKGKGVHYGIKRADHFIRSCSDNYHRDCYILRLDIKSYFISIRKELLYRKVKEELIKKEDRLTFDFPLILYLLEKTIFNDPTANCIVKGSRADWNNFPKEKSLFYVKEGCGLPIGNLTSQLFGNVYLSNFDHFVKRELKMKYYGRYVDDLIFVHQSKDYLKSIIPKVREYLKEEDYLELHPRKTYLQHFSKGVCFLGAVIKPYRKYLSKRVKGNIFEYLESGGGDRNTLNSYLGLMGHFSTFNMKKKLQLDWDFNR